MSDEWLPVVKVVLIGSINRSSIPGALSENGVSGCKQGGEGRVEFTVHMGREATDRIEKYWASANLPERAESMTKDLFKESGGIQNMIQQMFGTNASPADSEDKSAQVPESETDVTDELDSLSECLKDIDFGTAPPESELPEDEDNVFDATG